jgi:hypothetical protein
MAHKDMNPAPRAGGDRARDFDLAGELIGSENISASLDFQAFRVAHLARRHRLTLIAAGVVASLHWEARR